MLCVLLPVLINVLQLATDTTIAICYMLGVKFYARNIIVNKPLSNFS